MISTETTPITTGCWPNLGSRFCRLVPRRLPNGGQAALPSKISVKASFGSPKPQSGYYFEFEGQIIDSSSDREIRQWLLHCPGSALAQLSRCDRQALVGNLATRPFESGYYIGSPHLVSKAKAQESNESGYYIGLPVLSIGNSSQYDAPITGHIDLAGLTTGSGTPGLCVGLALPELERLP
jgi:hypothetical protein